jgi:hypothetical protein
MEDSSEPVFTSGKLYPVLDFGYDGCLVMDDRFDNHWIGLPEEPFLKEYFTAVTGLAATLRGLQSPALQKPEGVRAKAPRGKP